MVAKSDKMPAWSGKDRGGLDTSVLCEVIGHVFENVNIRMNPVYAITGFSGVAIAGILLVTQQGNCVAPTEGTSLNPLQVSTLEMPAQAARFVADAQPAQQATKVKEVAEVVAGLSKPDLMPYVVSAVAKACPEAAPEMVAAAAQALPQRALASTQAAIEAAPAQTEQIVAAVCQQRQTRKMALAVAGVAVQAEPSRSAAVLQTVATRVPQMRPYFAKAEANRNQDQGTDAMAVLQQVYDSVQVADVQKSQATRQREVARAAMKEQSAVHPIPLVPTDVIAQIRSVTQNSMEQVAAAQKQVQISAPTRGMDRDWAPNGEAPSRRSEAGYGFDDEDQPHGGFGHRHRHKPPHHHRGPRNYACP